MAASQMVLLCAVRDGFRARVLAARLGADGILCELRGAVGGLYPGMGSCYLYVRAEEEAAAREALGFDGAGVVHLDDEEPDPSRVTGPWWTGASGRDVVMVVTALVLLAATFLVRYV